MFKSFGFQVAVFLLIMHGVTVGMMQTVKRVRATSLFQLNRNTHNSIMYERSNTDTIAILQALNGFEKKLEKQNELLQNLYTLQNVINASAKVTKSYAFEIAKIEARCKIVATPGLDYYDQERLFTYVDCMEE